MIGEERGGKSLCRCDARVVWLEPTAKPAQHTPGSTTSFGIVSNPALSLPHLLSTVHPKWVCSTVRMHITNSLTMLTRQARGRILTCCQHLLPLAALSTHGLHSWERNLWTITWLVMQHQKGSSKSGGHRASNSIKSADTESSMVMTCSHRCRR